VWIFTRYGFYSIACANKADGSLDRGSVMIRARVAAHLKTLRQRFPALADSKILTWEARDYRYRVIVPKELWVAVAAELAQEQEWSNFKNEVARYQGEAGSDYVHALHQVWNEMCRLQRKAPAKDE
jgi:ribonuclease HII